MIVSQAANPYVKLFLSQEGTGKSQAVNLEEQWKLCPLPPPSAMGPWPNHKLELPGRPGKRQKESSEQPGWAP
jgi:hypothetical protein